jgi:ribosomal protein L29
MKLRQLEELKQKPKAELEELLSESRIELRKLTFDLNAGKVKNVQPHRELKKKIAVILTLLQSQRTIH